MNIAIVEDEDALAQQVLQMIKKLSTHQVSVFSSGEQFLFECESQAFDLVFMDIQMGKMSGIECAKLYRQNDANAMIVFLTNDASYVFEGYEVNAIRYWMKPVQEDKLIQLFSTIQQPKPYILWNVQGDIRKLYEADIYYIESDGHYVLCHTKDEVLRMKASFKDVCSKLSSAFIECHRSYCVHITHVHVLCKEGCRMDNQEVIPVSRAMKQRVQTELMKACKEEVLCGM